MVTVSQASRQLGMVGVALVIWALSGELSFWAAIASYLAAWALFNWGSWSKLAPDKAPRAATLGAAAVLLAGPLLALAAGGRGLCIRERVHGLGEHVTHRLRLERRPAIAPPIVVADQPQTFYVHAPGGGRATVSFGGAVIPGTPLGHGLFRIDYDPRHHGPPLGPARIDVDGARFEREMTLVRRYARPRWLVSEPARGLSAAVSEETDELFLIERSGRLRAVAVEDGPTDVALFDGGRRAAVAHRYSPTLAIVDTTTAEVIARPALAAFAARLAVSGSGRLLAASIAGGAGDAGGARRGVLVAELPGGREAGFAPLPFTPDWLTFAGEDAIVVAALEPRALVRIARRGDRWELIGSPLHLGRPVVTATRRPGAARWFVATTGYQPDGGMPEGNHLVQDQILSVDLERFSVVDQLLTARGGARQDDPGNVTSGASPMGLDLRHDGSLLLAFAGTDDVWRLADGGRIPEVLLDARRAGIPLFAPHGVADLGEGAWAASSPSTGVIAVFGEGGRPAAVHRLAPADEELGARDAAALLRRRGERVFYEATRAGASCQSCHPNAAHDHSAHDISSFGKEPAFLKGTLSTLGLAGTAPYLRTGGFPHIGDLDDVARTRYRGYQRREADRPGLLEAYLVGLPLPLNPRAIEGRDDERERRGVSAFVKGRCDLCHAFPAFTHLGQHPARWLFPRFGAKVGAGDLLDTPALRGLWAAPPYLIDGRAPTLEALLLEHNPDNRHGDTAALSGAEVGDLVYFLDSL